MVVTDNAANMKNAFEIVNDDDDVDVENDDDEDEESEFNILKQLNIDTTSFEV